MIETENEISSHPRVAGAPVIDRRALEAREEDVTVGLVRDRAFRDGVRSWLRTEEQRRYFDFIVDLPAGFLVEHAGTRLTHERIAVHLDIPQDRIPSLHKSLKRAFRRQLRLANLKGVV